MMLGSKDWGWFHYCDEARAEDKRNGYTVLFENVSCSQCGRDFGPGEHGFSHCSDHTGRQCANCRWSMPLEGRYDQIRCTNDESPEAWGDVEATGCCESFLPNDEMRDGERKTTANTTDQL